MHLLKSTLKTLEIMHFILKCDTNKEEKIDEMKELKQMNCLTLSKNLYGSHFVFNFLIVLFKRSQTFVLVPSNLPHDHHLNIS